MATNVGQGDDDALLFLLLSLYPCPRLVEPPTFALDYIKSVDLKVPKVSGPFENVPYAQLQENSSTRANV